MGEMNSELARVAAYVVATAVCVLAWRQERANRPVNDRAIWPRLWIATAGLLFGFAIARLLGAPSLITDVGRAEAHSAGLYGARRGFQSGLVAFIAVAWCAAVLLSVWRVPERRRRYLPAIVVVLAIVAFAAVRAVSLHHLDQILYNRPIWGVRGVVYVETSLLAVLVTLAAYRMWKDDAPEVETPSGAAEVDPLR